MKCGDDEHCGKWVDGGKDKNGCILSKYCDTQGFFRSSPVTYTCPSAVSRTIKYELPSSKTYLT